MHHKRLVLFILKPVYFIYIQGSLIDWKLSGQGKCSNDILNKRTLISWYASKVRPILKRFECECLDETGDNLKGLLDRISIPNGVYHGVNCLLPMA